jgi:hypothetical protein
MKTFVKDKFGNKVKVGDLVYIEGMNPIIDFLVEGLWKAKYKQDNSYVFLRKWDISPRVLGKVKPIVAVDCVKIETEKHDK